MVGPIQELPRYETRLNKIYNAYAPHTAPLIHGLPLAEWLEQLWGQHASTNDVKVSPYEKNCYFIFSENNFF